jgi:hypothetical protein
VKAEMGNKKNLEIKVEQQDDGGWTVSFRMGWRKNETVVAESVDSLLEKVSNKIGGYYRGYSQRVRDFPVGQRNILETS